LVPLKPFQSLDLIAFLKAEFNLVWKKGKKKSLSKPLAVQAPEDDLVGLEEILQAAADFAVDKIIPPSNEHNQRDILKVSNKISANSIGRVVGTNLTQH